MPAKEIKALRESGELKEALKLALQEYDQDKTNIWGKRNLVWVYYDMLKSFQGNLDEKENVLEVLDNIEKLGLPTNENLFFQQLAWFIGKYLFQIHKSQLGQEEKFKLAGEIFEKIKTFSFEKSSGTSFLIKALHSSFKNKNTGNCDFCDYGKKYIDFIAWIGFERFSEEDFSPVEVNGRKIISFVEQFIIEYSKVLLKGDHRSEKTSPEPGLLITDQGKRILVPIPIIFDEQLIGDFLIFLNQIEIKYSDYQYTLFYKSKLLLAIQRYDAAKASLIPFVKKKRNEFWAWDLLSEVFQNDLEMQIACLSKALMQNAKDSFLVNVHLKLGSLLVQKEEFTLANIEYNLAISIRKKYNWKLTRELIEIQNEDWFEEIEQGSNNIDFYRSQSELAEELLFKDHEVHTIVIDNLNKSKSIANFVKDQSLHGFFSYKHLKEKPRYGEAYVVRMSKIGSEGFHKIVTIQKGSIENSKAVQSFSGVIRIPENKNFGFVDDAFISPDTVDKYGLEDSNSIDGLKILSYNKKKQTWGWKVLQINQP